MKRVAFRTCPLCEATCGLRIEVEGESVTRVRGDLEDPFSKGYICPKGSALGRLHHDPDRLQAPRVRHDGSLIEVSWQRAFGEADGRLKDVVSRHGKDAVAVYLGNPNAHNFANTLAVRPLIKALGTKNVFSASTVDQMPKHVSAAMMFGHPLTIPVPDLDRTDYLLMLGANPLQSNGSLATAPDWPGRLARLRERGGRLVVVDPRRSKTAAAADEWIPIRPGTDAALLAGLARLALGGEPASLLAAHVNGWGDAAEALAPFTPSLVEEITGVASLTVERLAAELMGAERAAVYGRIGTHTTRFGTLASWLADVLNVATGNLDRPGGAMFPHAAHEAPSRQARKFQTGRWTSRVRGLPEVMSELPVATLADEILTEGEGKVRALVVIAGNPALTTPDSDKLARALDSLELLISVDPYVNATSRKAHVILPPPSALERSHYDLAFTALSVRNVADYSPPVFERAPGQPSEFEILVKLTAIAAGFGPGADATMLAEGALAQQVGAAVANPSSPIAGRDADEIMASLGGTEPEDRLLDLMLRTGHRGDGFGANPGGLSLAVLLENPHGIDFGPLEPRIPACLSTPSGKIELAPVAFLKELGQLRGEKANGLVMVGRRQERTGNSWTHNIEVLVKGRNRCTLLMHPEDAAARGVATGDTAEVSSAVGTLRAPVEVTESIMAGVVSLPYGWGHDLPGVEQSVATRYAGVNSNRLTDGSIVDPISGNAVLNAIPVVVSRAG